MHTFIRRLGVAAGIVTLVGGSATLAAPAAHAAPADCIKYLQGGFDSGPTIVAPRTKLLAQTTPLVNRVCDNMRVSIGISRTDMTGFRNQAAIRRSYEDRAYIFTSDFASLPGTWMVRQIAVGDSSGRLAVRKFTTAPYPVTALSESQLTGRPNGVTLVGEGGRDVYLQGYLKAYSRYGTWTVLAPGQRILLQRRPHGSTAGYQTFAEARTSSSGYWRAFEGIPRGSWDMRIVYVSPYRSVASDFTWLGVFTNR